jgi:hypothetical protein
MRPAVSSATLAALTFALASSACHQEPPAQGPAEKAGQKVDQAARDTKDAARDSKDDVKKDLDK